MVLLTLKLILIAHNSRLILVNGNTILLVFLVTLCFSNRTHNFLSDMLILALLNRGLLQLDCLNRLDLNLDWLELDRYVLNWLEVAGKILLIGLVSGRFQVLLRLLSVNRNRLNLRFYLCSLIWLLGYFLCSLYLLSLITLFLLQVLLLLLLLSLLWLLLGEYNTFWFFGLLRHIILFFLQTTLKLVLLRLQSAISLQK